MADMENILDSSVASTPDVIANIKSGGLAGSALQSAREAKNMTVEDAARQLRLSTHQILALELDDFAKLPNAMITRGFLRNYARLLDIDAVPLLQAYRVKMPDTGQTKLSLTSEHIVIKSNKKKSYSASLLVTLMLILGLGAWWFYTDENKAKIAAVTNEMSNQVLSETASQATNQAADENASDTPAPASQDPNVLPPQALPAAERLADISTPSVVAPSATDLATTQTPIKLETPKPASSTIITSKPDVTKSEMSNPEIIKLEVLKPGNESIKLKATQLTWVQVQNTAGDVIYERTIAAGGIENFDFKPPAKIIVGNATGVELFYKNQPIDLLSRAKNNVARINLE